MRDGRRFVGYRLSPVRLIIYGCWVWCQLLWSVANLFCGCMLVVGSGLFTHRFGYANAVKSQVRGCLLTGLITIYVDHSCLCFRVGSTVYLVV